MSEQPNTGPGQAQEGTEEQLDTESSVSDVHPRTEGETAVDDALGSTDNPH